MVPAEVLAELQPFVTLAEGLGRAAVQLVGDGGFSEVEITYRSPRWVSGEGLGLLPVSMAPLGSMRGAVCTSRDHRCAGPVFTGICQLSSLLAWQRSTCVGLVS